VTVPELRRVTLCLKIPYINRCVLSRGQKPCGVLLFCAKSPPYTEKTNVFRN